VYSEHPGKEFGKFVLSHGKFFNDAENDKGAYLSNYMHCIIKRIHRPLFMLLIIVYTMKD